MIQHVNVAEYERVLVSQHGQLKKCLGPGSYWFLGKFYCFERCDIRNSFYDGKHQTVLPALHPSITTQFFHHVDLKDEELALVFSNNRVTQLLTTGQYLLWKGFHDIEIKIIDSSKQVKAKKEETKALLHLMQQSHTNALNGKAWLQLIPNRHVGIVQIDGQTEEAIDPGHHAYWTIGRNVHIELFDQRQQQIEVSGQEILTKDNLNVRLNLELYFQIKDPVKLTETVKDWHDFLYKEAQFSLRQSIGAREFNDILDDKVPIDNEILQNINHRLKNSGIVAVRAGLKDIILPGEMREIINQVIIAEQKAKANLIKRREETASTRTMLNTAKLMTDNPTLIKLKEIELLEKAFDKVNTINVSDGFDGLIKNLVSKP